MKQLSDLQKKILWERATEAPFTGEHLYRSEEGSYMCSNCNNQLFISDTKFDAGCGWPSFYESLPNTTILKEDTSHGMRRVEVVCAYCGGHLGHVFDDAPDQPSGKRYCINSAVIDFVAKAKSSSIKK